jgi:group II intron reverse transcriptase/maturase
MVLKSDRQQPEAFQDGPVGVLAEHSTDGRQAKDAEENRSGSWGTEAQGTQSREGEAGHHVLSSGTTSKTLSCTEVFLKLDQIAKQAAHDPDHVFTSLAHFLSPDFLCAAYHRLRIDAAPGIDGVRYQSYAENLATNLADLWHRLRSKQYRATPVKRAWVEKEDGSRRPLGIAILEDKIVQRAVLMILEAIYEQDFYDFSYGFRRGRSAHDAIKVLRELCMDAGIDWIVDADVSGYFDNIDHVRLQDFIRRRVNDGSLRRLIGKWLKAGVLEEGELSYPDKGTPQGAVISPLLANVFLHYVLDQWFMEEIRPQLKGKAFLIRYADDFVIGCEYESEARWLMDQVVERFASHGLTIHPTKSHVIDFRRPSRNPTADGGPSSPSSSNGQGGRRKGNGTFDFLGFTHYWARSQRGFWVIKRRTMRQRQRRAFLSIWEWCRRHRHLPLKAQHQRLSSKLRGHYQYYGIRCNLDRMRAVYRHVKRAWRYWLSRRSHRSDIPWEKFVRYLEKHPLPAPRIVHSI